MEIKKHLLGQEKKQGEGGLESEKWQSTAKQILIWKGAMAEHPRLGISCQPGRELILLSSDE